MSTPPDPKHTHDLLLQLRQSYRRGALIESDLAPDWLTQLRAWIEEAVSAGILEPNAMVLATADADGRPNARSVLLRGVDERGLQFFTNYESAKGRELAANPRAAVVFPWVAMGRQVVAAGPVHRLSDEESDAYFATRPRGHQLGAAASPQSRVVPHRAALDDAMREVTSQYPEEGPVPRPPYWGGFLVEPETVEFWEGREDRLHDRLRYRRTDDGWVVDRLAP
ncbi:MAG TPA: pyridoxamine 5'-phosphate oxidase [Solirubrobacteraceae bacterium]|jgi:pyridoxamine 5'-phosphate oxidase|nr:pyridoxamine 5'-phosphate oxidase [Solirubrobacteraceae bacterium]